MQRRFDFRRPRNVSFSFYDYLLPEDLLFLRVQSCVSQDDHLWPEEFPDLDVE